MREYVLTTLNMIEYGGIYLKKQSAEYARILNVSDALHSIRSPYRLLSSYRDRETYPEHCQTFKMERFAKRIMPECRCATKNFSGQRGGGGLWNWGTSIKILSKTPQKRASQGNIFEFFLLDTLRAFLSKIRTLFSIFKKGREALHM